MSYVLPILIALPLLGALICAALPNPKLARMWAFFISLATFGVSMWALSGFDFQENLSKVPAAQRLATSVQLQSGGGDAMLSIREIGFRLHMGVDSISLWLVILTTLLMPLAVAASFGSIQTRQKEYYAWMLALLSAMLGVFVARDLLLFYIFFELTLIPMFFIIGIWGGPERRFAASKFFLFTFAGSVFLLAGIVYLGMSAKSFDLISVTSYAQTHFTDRERWLILLTLLAGFAVKVPLFPVHTWLPLAHTEAPTAGSVILAGVLLKLGTYGLLRLALPIGMISSSGIAFPAAMQVLAVLCITGIIYGALVAWVQRDIKKLVAYSSVSHLGFCVLGLFALNTIGLNGSVLYMINHGLSTGALFLVIGMIYDRYHTRDIEQLSGLARIMPKMAFFFVFFTLASIGLPGLNGFASEFLTVLGAFTSDTLGRVFGGFAALGVILGAIYMLHMLARVVMGPLKVPVVHGDDGSTSLAAGHSQSDQGQAASPEHSHTHGAPARNDLNGREIAILIPLALACLVLGVPAPLQRTIEMPIDMLLHPLPSNVMQNAPIRRVAGVTSVEPAFAALIDRDHVAESLESPAKPSEH